MVTAVGSGAVFEGSVEAIVRNSLMEVCDGGAVVSFSFGVSGLSLRRG